MATNDSKIERLLQQVTSGNEGMCVLSQVIVMRCRNGIDDYLFRRMTDRETYYGTSLLGGTYSPIDDPLRSYPAASDRMDAFLPNWDDDGWPIDTRNIDVIDISDYVSSYSFDHDLNFGSSQLSLSVANQDFLFSVENITFDPNKFIESFVVSGFDPADMPRNKITGLPVVTTKADPSDPDKFTFLPNYLSGLDGTPDASSWCPMFRENNIVKIREAYHDPDGDGLIWVNRFLGLVSVANSTVETGGKPGLQITCNDLNKLATKSTTERVYIPLLVANDAQTDPLLDHAGLTVLDPATSMAISTGKISAVSYGASNTLAGYDPKLGYSPLYNKVFYNPNQTSRMIEDIGFGNRLVDFQQVNEEPLYLRDAGQVFTGAHMDWAPVPDPIVFVGAHRAIPAPTSNLLPPAPPSWEQGCIVRWYDNYNPGGTPVKVERWNGIYMMLDRQFDPNGAYANGSEFLTNYANWSFVLETSIDITAGIDSGTTQSGTVMFGLYVEGSARVEWDGQVVGQVTDATLSDANASLTATPQGDISPIPDGVYTRASGNQAIVQPNEKGLITWTAEIVPREAGKPVKYHHLKIVYQCGSSKGFRNILALRWWGRNDQQRQVLMQNASSLDTVTIASDHRNKTAKQIFLAAPTMSQSVIDAFAYNFGDDLGNVNPPYGFLLPGDKAPKSNFPGKYPLTDFLLNTFSVIKGASPGYKDPISTGFTNFIFGINSYTDQTHRTSYIAQVGQVDPQLQLRALNGQAPDPQWYDDTIAQHYKTTEGAFVFGEEVSVGGGYGSSNPFFLARIPITPDDPDWGYNILYTRGGIEFRTQNTFFGQPINTDISLAPSYLGASAKYVYKAQLGSAKVDDILSDIMIEDALGVSRFNASFAQSSSASGPVRLPLYDMMRYGWYECYNGTTICGYGLLSSTGAQGQLLAGVTGAKSITFKPKVALAQVQQVPDSLRLDLETGANSFESIRRVLDVLRSNYYVYADENGKIRGRFLKQDGLPKILPPILPPIQPDPLNREYYSMTVVGQNTSLGILSDRESIFLGEQVLDLPDGTLDHNLIPIYRQGENSPYPYDSLVNSAIADSVRVLVFSPVFLSTNSDDINSVSISSRDLTARDKVSKYILYRRRYDIVAGWQFKKLEIVSDATGKPTTVSPYLLSYRDRYSHQFPERDNPSYDSFWVVDLAKVPDASWVDCSAPPNGIFEPLDLMNNPDIRPLMLGYDYKLEAMQSLSLPRDEFDAITRVMVYGQRNALSGQDLVARKETSVIFTSFANVQGQLDPTLLDNPYLPFRFRSQFGFGTPSPDDPRTRIKTAITQSTANGGSLRGFSAGWLTNTRWSDVCSSASCILVIDNPNANEQQTGSQIAGSSIYKTSFDTTNIFSDPWLSGYLGSVVPYPGSWDADEIGPPQNGSPSPSYVTYTDLKVLPREASGVGFPFGSQDNDFMEPYLHDEIGHSFANPDGTHGNLGYWTSEGKIESYYFGFGQQKSAWYDVLSRPTAVDMTTLDSLRKDRVRGGWLQEIKFGFNHVIAGGVLYPTDEHVITTADANNKIPNGTDYFEIFTLDFGKSKQVGRIEMLVGYAPYQLESLSQGKAQISLGIKPKYIRWTVGTSNSADVSGQTSVKPILYDVVALIDPSDNSDGFYGGYYYSHSTFRKKVLPSSAKNTASFNVGAELLQATAVGTVGPACEFFIQLELGSLDYESNSALGVGDLASVNWQVVASEQSIHTRPEAWVWDENLFKNVPTKARLLRIKARRISPVLYSSFLTRNSRTTNLVSLQNSATGLALYDTVNQSRSIKRKSGQEIIQKLAPDGYFLEIYRLDSIVAGATKTKYSIFYNNRSVSIEGLQTFEWQPGKSFWADGGEAGIIRLVMGATPPVLPAPTTSNPNPSTRTLVSIGTFMELQGKRNVDNLNPAYAGVNILPSFVVQSATASPAPAPVGPLQEVNAGYRMTPWFGILPPIYYSFNFISIQRIRVLEKVQIKQDYELRVDPIGMGSPQNEFYDPKLANNPIAGSPAKYTPQRTVFLPKRSKVQMDVNFHPYIPINHHTLLKTDPSSYTEGRALTTAFNSLQEAKSPRQAAQVDVIYFPELRVFQTVLVSEDCIFGYVMPTSTTSVGPYGRIFQIERIHVDKSGESGGIPKSTITLKDYQ